MELRLVNNISKKDPDVNTRDEQIYKIWMHKKSFGQFVIIKNFSKEMEVSEKRLKDIIYSGNIKNDPKYKDNLVFQKATTVQLSKTKDLECYPKIREKVLVMVHKNGILMKDVITISKQLKLVADEGMEEDVVIKAIDIANLNK